MNQIQAREVGEDRKEIAMNGTPSLGIAVFLFPLPASHLFDQYSSSNMSDPHCLTPSLVAKANQASTE